MSVAAEPVSAGEIIILDPTEITIGDRLRPIDPVFAEAQGRSMVRDGQIYPIDVCRLPGQNGWFLAGPGGHRLTGARIVGMEGIECRVVSANPASRQRREAVENLFRRANDPLERAAAVAQLVRLQKERAGIEADAHRTSSVPQKLSRQIALDTADTLETISNVYGWSEEVGAEIGFTGRTVRNDLLLYRSLVPSLISRLRDARHPIVSNGTQLRALAKLGEQEQADAVEKLVSGGAKTVAEATKSAAAKPKPDAEAKRLSTFIGTFQRMALAERKGALAHLRDLLPAGFKLVSEGGEK
ncbi:hypothetical protein ACX0GZ_04290 [Sphingomonas aestuarii]